jgi:hypothetical protein
MWTFTIPKMLRPYFLHHRELLGKLCRAAWETVQELMASAACEDVATRPGMVAVVHTAGGSLGWHPHIHALVSRGVWSRDGTWVPVPYVDMKAAELLFRHKVLGFLKDEELVTEERIELLLSWRHSGFSVDSSVKVDAQDTKALERVARYILRPPLSLERLHWDEGCDEVCYAAKHTSAQCTSECFDPCDLLARLIIHISEPRLHTTRLYGHYSNVARCARRQKEGEQTEYQEQGQGCDADDLPPAERRRLRRLWAQMIRRVYEVDPLICDCGAQMRIISFILDPKVVDKILSHLAKNATETVRGPPEIPPEPENPPF